MKREELKFEISIWRIVVSRSDIRGEPCASSLEQDAVEGESPFARGGALLRDAFDESGCLGMQLQVGGKYHLRLNSGERPIANKYREGKMKRTLKRELNST